MATKFVPLSLPSLPVAPVLPSASAAAASAPARTVADLERGASLDSWQTCSSVHTPQPPSPLTIVVQKLVGTPDAEHKRHPAACIANKDELLNTEILGAQWISKKDVERLVAEIERHVPDLPINAPYFLRGVIWIPKACLGLSFAMVAAIIIGFIVRLDRFTLFGIGMLAVLLCGGSITLSLVLKGDEAVSVRQLSNDHIEAWAHGWANEWRVRNPTYALAFYKLNRSSGKGIVGSFELSPL